MGLEPGGTSVGGAHEGKVRERAGGGIEGLLGAHRGADGHSPDATPSPTGTPTSTKTPTPKNTSAPTDTSAGAKPKAPRAGQGKGTKGSGAAKATRKPRELSQEALRLIQEQARPSVKAQVRGCPRCASVIICAYDAPVAAIWVCLDPVPLDGIGELKAMLEGRPTYALAKHAGAHVILERDQWRITADITREHPVLATHRCPGPVPATLWHQVKAGLMRKRVDRDGPVPF